MQCIWTFDLTSVQNSPIFEYSVCEVDSAGTVWRLQQHHSLCPRSLYSAIPSSTLHCNDELDLSLDHAVVVYRARQHCRRQLVRASLVTAVTISPAKAERDSSIQRFETVRNPPTLDRVHTPPFQTSDQSSIKSLLCLLTWCFLDKHPPDKHIAESRRTVIGN